MSLDLITDEAGAWYLGGELLHPAQDPLAAAQKDLAKLMAGAGPDDLVVLAGCGLGWHARAVLTQQQGPRLVVYEPDLERRRLMQRFGPYLEDLELAEDEQALAEALGRHLVYGGVNRVALYAPPAYRRAAPMVVETARRQLDNSASRRVTDQATRRGKGGLWLEHLAVNLLLCTELPDPTLLAGALAGLPALVVGAGPSLDQSLAEIAAARDKALILAAASALAPLAGVGVCPQLALALEARDESRQFAGAEPQKTLLAAASAGHPNHFALWPGQRAMFHLQPWVAALSGQGQALPNGGHAGSAAFSLAILLGCDPVIIVGQDLAYSQGRIHAKGRPGGEDYQMPEMSPVPAIGGGQAQTSAEMLSYLVWYQEAAAYLRRQHPQRRVINATAAGALIQGFEHQELGRAVAGLGSIGQDLDLVAAAVQRLPRCRPAILAANLNALRTQVSRALADLEGQGLAALLAGLEPGSAAAWALEGWGPQDDPQQAAGLLEQLLAALSGLKEALDD